LKGSEQICSPVSFIENTVYELSSLVHDECTSLARIHMAFFTMFSSSKLYDCHFISGLKFFSARALQLLNSMFQFDDMHIIGSFLHPNYKSLRSASATQIDECHQTCRRLIATTRERVAVENITDEPEDEPPQKKQKVFLESLMDHNRPMKKKNLAQSKDEVDRYIDVDLQEETFLNPLVFWKRNELAFPRLSRLARRYFSVPCSSAAVERQFSAAGQIITQRRSTLDPSTINDILFLRSIEGNQLGD
jgi:hypothetical protein